MSPQLNNPDIVSALRRGHVDHLNAPTLAKIAALEEQADTAADKGDYTAAGRLLLTADNYRLLLVQY